MLYIYHYTRTAFAKINGEMNHLSATDIGKHAVAALLAKSAIHPSAVDEVILGCVCQPVEAANIARVIALRSGLPESVIASTVHRNCASGMESITTAYERMHANQGQLFVVGGCESMSNAPNLYSKSTIQKFSNLSRASNAPKKLIAALQFRPKDFVPIIGLRLGLTDPFTGLNMGQTAEILSREYTITRAEQDSYSVRSHLLATKQLAARSKEISPIYSKGKVICSDDGVRSDTSVDKIERLKPIFDPKNGTITAANSSQITDGAAVLLAGSAEIGSKLGLTPIGRLRGYAYAGCNPKRMGLGPLFAIQKLLKNTQLNLNQADVIEINEAFAAQVLACIKISDSDVLSKKAGLNHKIGPIDENKINLRGGAIALGHPVGATGARLILTALDQLKENNKRHALTSLCIGGGQGAAIWIERLN